MDTDVYNALMGAILAEPAADLPRLVMADFLEESGQPERAEFIRIQVEIAALPPVGIVAAGPSVGRFVRNADLPLMDREAVLFCQFAREWFGDMVLGLDREGLDDLSPTAPGLIVGRGFPHTARGPLGWFVGGTCVGCRGEGFTEGQYRWTPDGLHTDSCQYCRGTGRTPANGPELVRKWPLTGARVGDVTPYPEEDGTWTWYCDGGATHEADHDLPQPLFDRLSMGRPSFIESPQGWREYVSEADAVTDLSTALLCWALSTPVAV